MKKYNFVLTVAVIALFIGAGIVPSVVSNNSNIDIQPKSSDRDENLIVWAGDATVRWPYDVWNPFKVNVTITNPPDQNYTINLPGPTTLNVECILNMTLIIKTDRLIQRGGYYFLQLKAGGVSKSDHKYLFNKYEGNYTDQLVIIIPVEITQNTTLTINVRGIMVWPIFWIIPMKWKVKNCGHDEIVQVQLP